MSYFKKGIKFLNWFLFRLIIVGVLLGIWRLLPQDDQTSFKKIVRYANPQHIVLCDKKIKIRQRQYVLMPFGMNQTADLTVEYKKLSGDKVNVILMTQDDYLRWERSLESYSDAGKKTVLKQPNMKNIKYLKALSTFEYNDSKKKARLKAGNYYLVLDNTGFNSDDAVLNLKIIINN